MSDATPMVGTDAQGNEYELFSDLTPEEAEALEGRINTPAPEPTPEQIEIARRTAVVDRARDVILTMLRNEMLIDLQSGEATVITAWPSYGRIYVRLASANRNDIISIGVSAESEMSRYDWEVYATYTAEQQGHNISKEWEYASHYGYLNRCESCMALGVIPKVGEPYGELLSRRCTSSNTDSTEE